MVHFVRSLDEMQAQMQVRAGAIAGLVTLFAGCIFGVAEIYGALDPVNPALLMPIAAVAHTLILVIQEMRLR